MLNSVKHEPETYTLHMYIIDINAGHANGEIIEYVKLDKNKEDRNSQKKHVRTNGLYCQDCRERVKRGWGITSDPEFPRVSGVEISMKKEKYRGPPNFHLGPKFPA